MDTLKTLFSRSWRPTVVVIGLGLLAYFLYFHRLDTLLPGYSTAETASFAASSNWHTIANNPVDAPYKGLVWVLSAVLHHGFIATRIVSAAFGIVAVLLFFAILRRLFSFQLACVGTILFATSAGFLHFARLGTPQILEMGVLVFMGAIVWYRRSERKALLGYLVVLLCATLCYVPGLIWYELLGFILLSRNIRNRLGNVSALHVVGYSLLFLASLAPLILAGSRNTDVLLTAAGLPTDIHVLSHFVSNFVRGILSIGLRSNGDVTLWVGHTPLLNIVELVVVGMGVYYYAYRERSVRTLFMIGAIIVSLLLIGFGSLTGYAALVPILYVFMASGLHQLIGQWLTVFPRNPLARITGITLVGIMLFFSVLYQVRSYFVAWPHNSQTRAAFAQRCGTVTYYDKTANTVLYTDSSCS